MNNIEFIVFGIPQAQKRVKFSRFGNFVNVRDPSKADKHDFAAMASINTPDDLITGAIMITLHFYFPRPKGHFGTGRNSDRLKASAPVLHTKKPDIDNLEKFVLDSLNKVMWKDDSQVFSVVKSKSYTLQDPRTEIKIEYDV